MTGTPEGIAPVKQGDVLQATLSYKGNLISTIVENIKKECKPSFAVWRIIEI